MKKNLLKNDSMAYRLDSSKLKKGDILLTRNKKGIVSWLIRIFTLSPYSHAALYVGGNSYMEAIGCGVHARNILRETFIHKRDVIILRANEYDNQQIGQIIDFIRFRHGMAYSVCDAIKSGISIIFGIKLPLKMHSHQTFCSQLVASAYASINEKKFNGRKCMFVRPKDIYKEKSLLRIDDVYESITDEEVAEAAKEGIIDKQDRIVSSMMKDIWAILKEEHLYIKGVSEIDFGIAQIKDESKRNIIDSQINEIIQKSGYLTMWKGDMEKCPENYSSMYLTLKVKNPVIVARIASEKFNMWQSIAEMRKRNVEAAVANYNCLKLQTSKSFLELEVTLLEIAQKAMDEFDDFLRTSWNMGLTPHILNKM